jgi:hypothetical protein
VNSKGRSDPRLLDPVPENGRARRPIAGFLSCPHHDIHFSYTKAFANINCIFLHKELF